ncbi:MAG: tRNA (adenosine(37)-N6)-threonylcarbamoyltransferase complex dimerization subunit type 1 TsaB [Elusimicrobia bacterium]|nr:tRNA (adenosine(37)-N6)-threonylcarbamoyltransferase complex dimerization subunit type 1 TsaB [Elusimicrobiota bacterium]
MNILSVDATGEVLSAAVGCVQIRRKSKKHDEALLPLVEAALKKARLSWRDLDAVAAACGPGRFTGIRIGMSFAAAAGFQLKIPALAVSRLEAAAEKSGAERVLAALPGWKGEVYHQVFRRLKPVGDAAWSVPADWPAARAAAEASGLPVAYGDVGAAELLPVARRLLAARRVPPFKPLYLKPAGYERPRG